MTYAAISQQVAIPVIGFTALMGSNTRNMETSRPGDRQSDVLDYFAAAFLLMAVSFGPTLTWLLVG